MAKPRIRHVAINVQDRDNAAEFYVRDFGLVEKARGANGTIYLSDGFVDVALICNPKRSWGIQHFGFQVGSIKTILS
jgi:catechol-2,3-dioxygenase